MSEKRLNDYEKELLEYKKLFHHPVPLESLDDLYESEISILVKHALQTNEPLSVDFEAGKVHSSLLKRKNKLNK